jgi:hypothetical protein
MSNLKFNYDSTIQSHYDRKLELMLQKHSRVIQQRLDLHYPSDNSIITNLTRKLNSQKDIKSAINNFFRYIYQ